VECGSDGGWDAAVRFVDFCAACGVRDGRWRRGAASKQGRSTSSAHEPRQHLSLSQRRYSPSHLSPQSRACSGQVQWRHSGGGRQQDTRGGDRRWCRRAVSVPDLGCWTCWGGGIMFLTEEVSVQYVTDVWA
jgi:hypothetical protein